MDKFDEMYDKTDYSHMSVLYKTTALVTINEDYKGDCGLFINDMFIVILNKKCDESYFLVSLHNITQKNGFLSKKAILEFPIEEDKVTIDFSFAKERDNFIDSLNGMIESIRQKHEEEIEKERQEEYKKKRTDMPYEELKKLKELYDLEILTEEEYKFKRNEMLKDYL
ncbi:hypothetical protein [Mammaliicoccus sciuri]|uniref:hypothetical protein n=1 Tax=Mammaliicoccus sciuri TaxID=1296 RepID=UPI002887275F|nr:hypothetical protein [Mammaliicoccus sciuri]MDT0754995.1 hypothetical protein [Mammaliicoccus sciuri]